MHELIDPESATGEVRDLFDATRRQLGRVPNLYRAMAGSPAALGAYLAFREALGRGVLDPAMRERIALLTAQLNDCDYCVAAHSFRSQKMGLTGEDIDATRRARSESPKIHASLSFVKTLIEHRGTAGEDSAAELARHGWTEMEIGEMIGHVALNVFSNHFKQVANPALDFPPAPALVD